MNVTLEDDDLKKRDKIEVLSELLRKVDRICKRTGLEPVEAVKNSECHELLKELVS